MKITVRLFAALRERAGQDRIELDLPPGASVGDALAQIDHLSGGARIVLAVNREYAEPGRLLVEGDELAAVPPVSGGAISHQRLGLA